MKKREELMCVSMLASRIQIRPALVGMSFATVVLFYLQIERT
jgi:hypothetical protein